MSCLLATAGFLGVGAYTAGNLSVFYHWPMPFAVLSPASPA